MSCIRMARMVKVHRKKNGLAFGIKNNTAGFGLFEVILALALVALLTSIVVPALQTRLPRYERTLFIARLSALLRLAWRTTIITHTLHKVSFDFQKRVISVQEEVKEKEKTKEKKFVPLKRQYASTDLEIPETIDIKEFIVEGFDELRRFTGRKTVEVWIYMVPEGLVQSTIINMLDMKDTRNGKPRQIGLVVNPFTAQVSVYDAFQS